MKGQYISKDQLLPGTEISKLKDNFQMLLKDFVTLALRLWRIRRHNYIGFSKNDLARACAKVELKSLRGRHLKINPRSPEEILGYKILSLLRIPPLPVQRNIPASRLLFYT